MARSRYKGGMPDEARCPVSGQRRQDHGWHGPLEISETRDPVLATALWSLGLTLCKTGDGGVFLPGLLKVFWGSSVPQRSALHSRG